MKYRIFGKSGLRVSEICLGTMTFGTEWGYGADRETSKKIFEAYAGAGGNFIDTANRYTEGTSESFVGEFIAADRDRFVLASKYSLQDRKGDPNFSGNHKKNLHRSVEQSLRRLRTEYLDILWLHAWDFTTPVEEVMHALHDMVCSGKVHHLAVSDTPAWIVAQANTLAEHRGWHRFTGLQVEYSLIQRTPERDLLPMAKAFDLAVTPWAPLAGGALTGKYLKSSETGRVPENSLRRNDRSMRIAQMVVQISKEIHCTPTQVALAWLLAHNSLQTVIPIVGARTVEQITDSLGSTVINLSRDQIERLQEVSAIELGFPHDFLSSDGVKDVLFGGTYANISHKR